MQFLIVFVVLWIALLGPVHAQVQTQDAGWHGLTVETLSAEDQKLFGLPLPFGAIVTGVDSDSPALKADLRINDVIVSVGSDAIADAGAFAKAMATREPGDAVTIFRYRRDPVPTAAEFTLERKPAGWRHRRALIGVNTRAPRSDEFDGHGLKTATGALIVAVGAGKPAAKAGLRIGDLIVAADGRPVASDSALTEILRPYPAGAQIDFVFLRAGERNAATLTTVERPRSMDVARSDRTHLMLDTGGHMAGVAEVVFTPDGKQVISAGSDKLIRVWDLELGRTVRTIRGEVRAGRMGQVHTVALSPDGRWLAVGGWFGSRKTRDGIRLYEFGTGKLVTLLKGGHRNVVHDLSFSRDGRRLVSGSGDKTAIIWEAPAGEDGKTNWARGQLAHRLEGHTSYINKVRFSPNGARAITASDDTTVKVWASDTGAHLATLEGHRSPVRALSVSPEGSVASADMRGEIRIWSGDAVSTASSGAVVGTSRLMTKLADTVGSISFSPDGTRILSTCAGHRCGWTPIVWDVATGTQVAQAKSVGNSIFASAWSPDGHSVATAGGWNYALHVWSPQTGQPLRDGNNQPLELSGVGQPFRSTGFSADGRWIGWGRPYWDRSRPRPRGFPYGPLQFALRLPSEDLGLGAPIRLNEDPSHTLSDLRRGIARMLVRENDESMPPETWRRFVAPTDRASESVLRAASRAARKAGDRVRSYTLSPDGSTVVMGDVTGNLRAYNGDGTRIENFISHGAGIWGLTPSPDGRLLVSGSTDQTLRIWNFKTRELIATLFHARSKDGAPGDWVVWTPQGFYMGSRNAGSLVGWQINQGRNREARYVTGAQFRRKLNRPDIVEEALRLASATEAVAKLAPDHDLTNVLDRRPPTLTRPSNHAAYLDAFRGTAVISAYVAGGSAQVDSYRLSVNGISVPVRLVAPTQKLDPPPDGQVAISFRVPLMQGPNDVLLTAVSDAGGEQPLESRPLAWRIRQRGEGPLDRRDRLHIIAIGVDRYEGLGNTCGPRGNESCDLTFAAKDARLFAETVAREVGMRHTKGVRTRILTSDGAGDDKATRANILAALDSLKTTGINDTIAVFFAGHGERGPDGKYYVLPTDISRSGGFSDAGGGGKIIEWAEMQSRVLAGDGRRLIFLDSCQAGAVGAARAYNGRLIEDAQYENFVAFMAAGPNQFALERADVGQGLFTHAITEGLKGAAQRPGDDLVRVLRLGAFVAERVFDLSNGAQRPIYTPHADFVLAAR